MSLPKDFRELASFYATAIGAQTILIVNTPTTGGFLNRMFLGKNTTRICYDPKRFGRFIRELREIQTSFDLICVDPYHEYRQSMDTFRLLVSLLSERGILISHDCCPPNLRSTSPTFLRVEWCGLTYAALIEIAYEHPEWYYGVLDTDYGLGIIAKQPNEFVKCINDHEKQKTFVELIHQSDYAKAFGYFQTYSSELINVIT